MERTKTYSKPPGPLFGFWSWRYLNIIKTASKKFNKRIQAAYRDFPTRFPPGSEFPEIELETANGEVINTADFKGKKHFVLFTGAIT